MQKKNAPLWCALVCLALLFLSGAGAGEAAPSAPAGGTLKETRTTPAWQMRGFGRVAATGWLWTTPAGEVSYVRFDCVDAAHAAVVAAKYRADLLAYGAVTEGEALPGVGAAVVEVRHGGVWLVGIKDAAVFVASAPAREALTQAAQGWGADGWQAAAANAYPRFLENFDLSGLALWWMPTTKTPEEMAFLKDVPAALNIHGQKLSMSPAPGVFDSTGTENALAQVAPLKRAHRQMLWCGSPTWFNYLSRPGDNFTEFAPGDAGQTFLQAGGYYAEQVASAQTNLILNNSLVSYMRRFQTDPTLMAWMDPHGEYQIQEPSGIYPDYARRYPEYLQTVKGYSLRDISARYTGEPRAYREWSELPLPDTAYFAGRRGQVLDLDLQPWRWKKGSLDVGEKAGWAKADFDDKGWTTSLREDKRLLSSSSWWAEDNGQPLALWYRFTQGIPAEYLDGLKGRPVYLHLMPFLSGKLRGITVWLNGEQVGRDLFDPTNHMNTHVEVDLSGKLKAGENRFAICSPGGRIDYRVFLSDQAGESFPFAEPGLNRRYLDWRDYQIWEKFVTMENTLRLMRAVDPDRPIKVMTPGMFQTEAMRLFEKYGAYPQLTGETNWYRPMHYKGYARLRGLPGSSEPGGPQKDARSMQVMFSNIFWESQDCHDYVFDLSRDLWPYKDAVQWWRDNAPLLRTLGKTDFPLDAKLGLLRDTRQDSRYATGEIWNWDPARGPLPAIGLSPILIDGPEMDLGSADKLPVIMDCATTVMEPATVAAIKRYVENGGIFITQHHTGRHSAERRDSWPLARAFGLSIEPCWVAPGRVWNWPLGKIKFTTEQDLFPSLRGKSCDGSGVAIDWKDNKYAGAVAIGGNSPNVRPVAMWEDGRLAVADVRLGKGRLIVVGTPFFLRFKDENGRWMNDEARQQLLRELLESVGVKSGMRASDGRMWYEKRVSKNGLYDVLFAGALQVRGGDWKLTDRVASDIEADLPAQRAVIEATATGTPDLPAEYVQGKLRLKEQGFAPFQVRQYAVLREAAGLRGPLHWLEVQSRTWRALQPEAPQMSPEQVLAETKKLAQNLAEAGQAYNDGWRVRIDPADAAGEAWVKAETTGADWKDGALGSWLANGWENAACVQYRKKIALPAGWNDPRYRILLGISSPLHNDRAVNNGTGVLWLNGERSDEKLPARFLKDVTERMRGGDLDLALQVTADPKSKRLEKGPFGTLYLRRIPAVTDRMELPLWSQWKNWEELGGEVKIPLPDKTKVFGLHASVKIPAQWAGRPVHLVIEQTNESDHHRVGAGMINGTAYFKDGSFHPVGQRVDRWLKPGEENTIDLFGVFHGNADYSGFVASIKSISLEVYPAEGK